MLDLNPNSGLFREKLEPDPLESWNITKQTDTVYYTTSRRLQTYSDVLANGQTSGGRGREAGAAQDRKVFFHNLLSGLSKFLKNTKALKGNRLIEGEKKNTSKKKK